ncbi:Hsp70 family protein [Dactylosporangium sp. NPDC000521]|uniref:Hsp70 family protein n=1 Tax=Dactylosporangium sp. NPDC000521 TaxID=3363975 RepID=UPI003684CF7A
MRPNGYRVGVDFGTSTTAAVMAWPDGRVKPLLFDATPLLPSAVLANSEGGLLVGRDAVHAALAAPAQFEPHPKRRIDEGRVLLGERAVAVQDLIAAVLRRVVYEARRVAGTEPAGVVLTYPAVWGARRRGLLSAAAAAAGLPRASLVPEPVAAAAYFVSVHGAQVPAGAPVMVYDFGGGTFDATVVRRRNDLGFEVFATRGLDDAGGLDIDAAIIAQLGSVFATRDAVRWQRLTRPDTTADRRAAMQLWDHVRTAKEALSRTSSTVVHVPLFDDDAPLGREQLDQLATPVVDRTISVARSVLRDAGLEPSQVATVFLVGGSSRLPLAASLLHRRLGVTPTVLEQPELVVAEGSLHAAVNHSTAAEDTPPKPATRWAPALPPTPTYPTPSAPMPAVPISPGPTAATRIPPTTTPAASVVPARMVTPTTPPSASMPITAKRPVWTPPPVQQAAAVSPPSRRRRRIALLTALAIAVLVAAVGVGGFGYARSRYYVGVSDDGYAAAFQGLRTGVAGWRPHWEILLSPCELVAFAPDVQEELRRGIDVASEAQAGDRLSSLALDAVRANRAKKASSTPETPTPQSIPLVNSRVARPKPLPGGCR